MQLLICGVPSKLLIPDTLFVRKITHKYHLSFGIAYKALYIYIYRGADKSLVRLGKKQANVSVRMI